ncbi:hypothetical protein SCP_0212380 [Sparassis crispa]|uniref:AAA+ ATPase domain-containing protein n=1 Tax=Sparassis crispa TaxID=139825 RepID=A0A401GCX3_9APHY|nr:hypothetical protein SCP_0212380 [Sparassis crispa]GBE80036.1 hypothetical protein SCP_0212380 [Sparassis crispa]
MKHNTTDRAAKELEDAFIKVTFEEDGHGAGAQSTEAFYDTWVDHVSAKFSDAATYGAIALQKLYPEHSIVLSTDRGIDILSFPSAAFLPMSPTETVSSVYFVPFARRLGQIPGILVNMIRFAAFHVSWDAYDFILYIVRYPQGISEIVQHYVLHEGPEEHSRALLVAAGAWQNQLHDEILVFNQGLWRKNHELWMEVQKANWGDVILKESFKTALQKDVRGFFDSEELYKSLSVPWKRGLILHGPPGNGKTISVKAIMKDCDARGYATLYVKSFKSYMGEEGSMAAVFSKAREMAPCVIVLEDLDSLINDANRSFFLNQLDGLEGNDGLLVIGSTNHFDKLDPALSGRPSRFDRKYPFEDPDQDERALYARYWQGKLKSNHSVSFPDSLVDEVASATDGFSFAYLKEAFVSALVLLAGDKGDEKPVFATVLLGQIKSLRDQLKKQPHSAGAQSATGDVRHVRISGGSAAGGSDGLPASCLTLAGRIWSAGESKQARTSVMPGGMPGMGAALEGRPHATLAALGRSFV